MVNSYVPYTLVDLSYPTPYKNYIAVVIILLLLNEDIYISINVLHLNDQGIIYIFVLFFKVAFIIPVKSMCGIALTDACPLRLGAALFDEVCAILYSAISEDPRITQNSMYL